MEAFLTSTFPFIKWDAIVGPASQCCEGRGGKGQEGPVQCLRCSGRSLFPTVSAAALGGPTADSLAPLPAAVSRTSPAHQDPSSTAWSSRTVAISFEVPGGHAFQILAGREETYWRGAAAGCRPPPSAAEAACSPARLRDPEKELLRSAVFCRMSSLQPRMW